jgi:hypothetical protein
MFHTNLRFVKEEANILCFRKILAPRSASHCYDADFS